ncbi:discoidin domain-containing protein [Actinoplanes sp. NPDC049668]|uniref:discoidin domain-containing protein n=1 Tax=unclassified Actinoplanes TaxID=2626549 RepID=UPI0033A4C18E
MLALSRRQLLALAGVGGISGALTLPGRALAATPDPVAERYREALHAHTRWVEEQWDTGIGAYRAADFCFVSVLGNAVLLRMDDYDPRLADVDAPTLKAKTLATIARYAATNRLAGGTEWGRRLFWDSTFELYFVLAARLLWDDLDEQTRANIDRIAAGQAAYAYGLGSDDDPLSGGWSPRGTTGGWAGDTRLEEMGVYAQALAPGLAWAGASDEAAEGWQERFLLWATNASGLPVADLANPAVVDGERIDLRTTAHNLHDTFIVENHGSVNPHYQAELWRMAGRAAIHFLLAGRPLPQVLTAAPNGEQLWATLRLLASDAGEPVMPMVADRYHLYGRDVLPLAFLAQVQGDRDAARAEADLAERLMPYLRYEPKYRLTKFSGEEKYEPEARAELAISYLFHRLRTRPVQPVGRAEFFRRAGGTRDFGKEVGLTAHQSEHAFAGAVTKAGFVNFLWQPKHDNWLIDTREPAFLPAGSRPTGSWTRAYQRNRDGLDATATVLAFDGDRAAGFATLPTGAVVYASTGLSGEGRLTLFTLDMPGMPGLSGKRRFTTPDGGAVLGDQGKAGVTFSPRDARWVRMLGREPGTEFGYSIFTFAVLDTKGADLAQGAMPTASSEDIWNPARNATDGNPETRWAVAREERGRADSWLAVDLGSAVKVAGVRIDWEAAYGKGFVIQTSTDGLTWTDAAAVPETRSASGWVGVDGRFGIVTHGTSRKIVVSAGAVSAPAPVIEGYPGTTTNLAAAAARTLPTAEGLLISDADGYLSVFNLTPARVDAAVRLPSGRRIYRGKQTARGKGLEWATSLAGGTAVVEPPRFLLDEPAPDGTRFEARDSNHLQITAPARRRVDLTVRAGSWSARVRLRAGRSRTLVVPGHPVTPTADLARGRTTFPTSPLPAGMNPPARAVDGDPRTAWRPGESGRMVVDLGAVVAVDDVRLTWSRGRHRKWRIEASADGLTYSALGDRARYVAVAVEGWRPGDAELIELAVL